MYLFFSRVLSDVQVDSSSNFTLVFLSKNFHNTPFLVFILDQNTIKNPAGKADVPRKTSF